MSYELRAAVRSMLLPVVSAREAGFMAEVERSLNSIGIAEDKANWIALQLRRWKRDGSPTTQFRIFVRDLLFLDGRDPVTFMFDSVEGPNGEAYKKAARSASGTFFVLHAALKEQHLLHHDAARQIMSHTGMIARLAVEERMTASEISRLITVRDNRFSLNWRAVKAILGKLGCAPTLGVEDFDEVFTTDKEAEPTLLGDLDLKGCTERVAEVAETLGCKGEFAEWLSDLFLNQVHAPYLPLLHYQLSIQAKYDHAVTYGYEFEPRGMKGKWLTDKYIDAGIPVGKNAVLNNAKATLRFDQVWVMGRDDNLRPAAALANILEAVENLGSLAKDELASQIRGLLHRYIRLKSEEHGGVLPHEIPVLTLAQATALTDAIGHANTRTTGILEQRLVDCYGLKHHPGWANRGLRDSVFAANTFRKKLGDIEFEQPARPNPRIEAYESHGGRLTLPYVHDHLDSFDSVLGMREEEFRSIAPLADWRFVVIFVAHAFDSGLPPTLPVRGCNVELQYVTFADAACVLRDPGDIDIINDHLIAPLNNGFVHPNVRETVLNII